MNRVHKNASQSRGGIVMKRWNELPGGVDVIAQLADLKEVDYKNTLVLTAMVELLVEKGLLTRQEVIQKARQLDVDLSVGLDRSLYAN
jgi:hypothetical protein